MWREPKKKYFNDELFPRKKKIENQSKIAGYQSQFVTQTKIKNQETYASTRAALEYGAYEKVLYQS